MKQLADRIAVITGAGSGIGRATAHGLAAKGCHLALTDVHPTRLDEVKAELANGQTRVTTYVVDAADREAMQRLPDQVVADHGAAHILINNAGVTVDGTLEEQSLEDLDWIMGINLWGVVYGCKFFLPVLKAQEEGHIVNLSSMFGLIGLPGQSSYCATKAAVRSLSESLSAELASTNVGVTSVHPGGIRTNIAKDARFSSAENQMKMSDFFAKLNKGPDHAANKIVSAIERGKPRVRICKETYVTDWMKRLWPVTTSRLVNVASRWSEKRS